MFEAVETEDPLFKGKLTAKFGAHPPAAQQGLGGFFRSRGARLQYANARGWDMQEAIITEAREIGGSPQNMGRRGRKALRSNPLGRETAYVQMWRPVVPGSCGVQRIFSAAAPIPC